jgi:hypothetical protein
MHCNCLIYFHFRLIRLLHRYARENLLLANIYIKDPAVTMIRRDQKIPVIWFVANVGGILGLCMGCSLVTVFEVLHHIVLIFLRSSVKSVTKFHRTIRSSVPASQTHVPSGVTIAALMQVGSTLHMLPATSTGHNKAEHFCQFRGAFKNCSSEFFFGRLKG